MACTKMNVLNTLKSSENIATKAKGGEKLGARKTLQILQPNSNNQGLTRPGEVGGKQKKIIAPPSTGSVQVYEDVGTKATGDAGNGTQSCGCNCHHKLPAQSSTSTQTCATDTCDQSASELDEFETSLTGVATSTYWEDMAEQRRLALMTALEENANLHEKVQEQQEEIEQLTELANQAEYYSNILKELIGNKETEEGSEDAENQQDEEVADRDVTSTPSTSDTR